MNFILAQKFLKISGIDTRIFSTHSTAFASINKARKTGIPVDIVLQDGNCCLSAVSYKEFMYRVYCLQLGSNFVVWLGARKNFYLRFTVQKIHAFTVFFKSLEYLKKIKRQKNALKLLAFDFHI